MKAPLTAGLVVVSILLAACGSPGSSPLTRRLFVPCSTPDAVAQLSWSPDGKLIAFVSNRGGVDQVYVMNADGSAQIQLTDNPGVPQCFRWPF